MNKSGKLVISLDFELLWGVFDKVDYQEKESYFRNTRTLIPSLLELFREFDIHCTWATVGMLFNETWEEWEKNIPEVIPDYSNRALSAYHYGHSISNPSTEFLCLGKRLIEEIQVTPHQEIGTHTYSHYYCLEEGQTLEAFKKDLEKCVELASNMGVVLKSLVFPRNQFNASYLEVCYDLGIENVRSNPDVWYWKNTEKDLLTEKVFRTGDAYLGFNDKSYKVSELRKEEGKPLAQKASRLLRPYSGNKVLDVLKLNRIKSEMDYAAKNKEIYHLWWHPHNFANNPKENLAELRDILEHYEQLKESFDFQSATMAEINTMAKVI